MCKFVVNFYFLVFLNFFLHFFILTSLFVQHNDGTHPHFCALNKNITIQNFVQLHYLTFFVCYSYLISYRTTNALFLYNSNLSLYVTIHYHLNFLIINNVKSIINKYLSQIFRKFCYYQTF